MTNQGRKGMSKRIARCFTVAAPATWPESCWDGPAKVGFLPGWDEPHQRRDQHFSRPVIRRRLRSGRLWYVSTYSWPESSRIAYITSSVTDRRIAGA